MITVAQRSVQPISLWKSRRKRDRATPKSAFSTVSLSRVPRHPCTAPARRLEEYDSLRELVDALPQGAAELAVLGSMFESVGLGEDSVRALLRLGDPKAAIDSCIRLNHWERCARAGQAGLPPCLRRTNLAVVLIGLAGQALC